MAKNQECVLGILGIEKCLVDWEDLKERYDKAMMTSTKAFMEKAKAEGLELLI